jgi:formylglycine-generating enzyme required for sulfatase activity
VPNAGYASLSGLAQGSRAVQQRQREAVEKLGLPLEVKSKVVGIQFRLIPAGIFMMGSPTSEKDRDEDETQHRVTISRAFYMGKYQVTRAQWHRVMGTNPSQFKDVGENAPVECVSWNDCQKFMRKLDVREGLPEGSFRLPTEAEWEYACRAGTQTAFCYGDDLDSSMANFETDKITLVGSFKPNAWGLYDMHGNVEEWCQDWYGTYGTDYATDPCGPQTGSRRVVRGGSWNYDARFCRSANRYILNPDLAHNIIGFRFVLPTGQ